MRRLAFFIALLFVVPAGFSQTKVTTIQVRVVSGHHAKPVKHAETFTTIFPLSPYTTPIERTANKLGKLSLLTPTEGQLTLTVSNHLGCQRIPKSDRAKGPMRLSLQEILATGVVDANGCSKRSLPPTPGVLIYYVRPMHWWERLRN